MANSAAILLLQYSSNHGSLSVDEANRIIKIFCRKHNKSYHESSLKDLIEEVNELIKNEDRELVLVHHGLLKQSFIVLRVNVLTEIDLLQQRYENIECEYYLRLLNDAMNSENYSFSFATALTSAANMNNEKLTDLYAEKILKNYIEDGYFIVHDDSIYLGPKTIAEKTRYLKREYPTCVNECSLCNKLVFWEATCHNCNQKFHHQCIQLYLSKMTKCPDCSIVWSSQLN